MIETHCLKNVVIFVQTILSFVLSRKIKKLTIFELLRELPFYNDINISRKERAFKGYAETYKVEIIDNKSLRNSLSVSKNSIKNLFDEILREKRGF